MSDDKPTLPDHEECLNYGNADGTIGVLEILGPAPPGAVAPIVREPCDHCRRVLDVPALFAGFFYVTDDNGNVVDIVPFQFCQRCKITADQALDLIDMRLLERGYRRLGGANNWTEGLRL